MFRVSMLDPSDDLSQAHGETPHHGAIRPLSADENRQERRDHPNDDAEMKRLATRCEALSARVAELEQALQLHLRQNAAKDKLIEDLTRTAWWRRKPLILEASPRRG